MSSSGLATLLSVLGVVLGGVGAMLAVFYTRARDTRGDLQKETRELETVKTAAEAAQRLAEQAHEAVADLRAEVRELHAEAARVDQKLAVLDSKMDVFWRNVAIDVSKILHSPHPGWEELDALLEKFQDRTISPGEMSELEEQLDEMVEGRWEPAGVTRADQVAASLLLRAIQQTRV